MSTNVIDFSDMFRKNRYTDHDQVEDKENMHINKIKNAQKDVVTDDIIKIKLIEEKSSIESSNEVTHWKEQSSTLCSEMDALRNRLITAEKDKERHMEKISTLTQEVAFVSSKLAAVSNDHKSQRNRWSAEKTELEGKVFQLIAAQTQFQGSLRKKEKEFEKLQLYLQKQITNNKDTSSSAKLSKATTTTSTASKDTTIQSSIVISKPLPSNISQGHTSNVSVLAKDLEVMALKQTISDLLRENQDLKSKGMKNLLDENSNNSSINTNTSIRDILMLQSKLADMEQLLSKTKSEKEELETISRKRDREFNSTSTASSSASTAAAAVVTVANEEEVRSLQRQLTAAWKTINEQDALVHQALLGRLNGVTDDLLTETLYADDDSSRVEDDDFKDDTENTHTQSAVAAVAGVSPSVKRSRQNNDCTECNVFELPPASPATVALLKSCGWTDLPPVEEEKEVPEDK